MISFFSFEKPLSIFFGKTRIFDFSLPPKCCTSHLTDYAFPSQKQWKKLFTPLSESNYKIGCESHVNSVVIIGFYKDCPRAARWEFCTLPFILPAFEFESKVFSKKFLFAVQFLFFFSRLQLRNLVNSPMQFLIFPLSVQEKFLQRKIILLFHSTKLNEPQLRFLILLSLGLVSCCFIFHLKNGRRPNFAFLTTSVKCSSINCGFVF